MQDLSFLRYKKKFLKNILTKNAVRLAKISLHLYRNICYIDGTGKKNWIMIKRQYLKKRRYLLQIQFYKKCSLISKAIPEWGDSEEECTSFCRLQKRRTLLSLSYLVHKINIINV